MVRNKEISQQMRRESQLKILASARVIFARRGYFNCKVSDIAKAAEMSQGNVYWYFPSKEEILKAVLQEGFDTLEGAMVAAQEYPGTSQQKIDYLIDQFVMVCREQGDFIIIFLSLLGHGGLPFLRDMGFDTLEMGAHFHQHLIAIFSQASLDGVVADLEPNQLTVFFFSFFNGLMITYNQDWEELVPEEQIHRAVYRLLGMQSN